MSAVYAEEGTLKKEGEGLGGEGQACFPNKTCFKGFECDVDALVCTSKGGAPKSDDRSLDRCSGLKNGVVPNAALERTMIGFVSEYWQRGWRVTHRKGFFLGKNYGSTQIVQECSRKVIGLQVAMTQKHGLTIPAKVVLGECVQGYFYRGAVCLKVD